MDIIPLIETQAKDQFGCAVTVQQLSRGQVGAKEVAGKTYYPVETYYKAVESDQTTALVEVLKELMGAIRTLKETVGPECRVHVNVRRFDLVSVPVRLTTGSPGFYGQIIAGILIEDLQDGKVVVSQEVPPIPMSEP
jgi:predicted membrane GTPase involved in stress response